LFFFYLLSQSLKIIFHALRCSVFVLFVPTVF
jgi:hypothetical protein